MIDCKELVSQLCEKLRECEYFSDKLIVSAYRKMQKPTVLSQTAVVCGILGMKAQNVSLGQSVKAGEISAFADLCVPFHIREFDFESAAQEVFSAFCAGAPASISASQVTVNTDMQCYVMRLTVTFSDALLLN